MIESDASANAYQIYRLLLVSFSQIMTAFMEDLSDLQHLAR